MISFLFTNIYLFTFNNYIVIQHVHEFTFNETFLSYEYIHSHLLQLRVLACEFVGRLVWIIFFSSLTDGRQSESVVIYD